MTSHPVVSREEWIRAREQLLAKEKEHTRHRDRLAAERRALPWVKVRKEYVFDGAEGPVTLADLFGGRSQLLVKHFMMPPGQSNPCVGCSFEVDQVEGALVHLEHHDFAYAAIARAPIAEIEAVRERMGWGFTWVSSYRSDFNYDFHVSFTLEEVAAKRAYYNYRWTDPGLEDLSGISVFYRDEGGEIFHTYATYGRGGEEVLTAYMYLDLMPKGRNEPERGDLTDWVRLHDRYGTGGTVDATGRYHGPACGCADAERQDQS
jgi:predicted dithiol-disulfide oxidoreductase (DUF899 family)